MIWTTIKLWLAWHVLAPLGFLLAVVASIFVVMITMATIGTFKRKKLK